MSVFSGPVKLFCLATLLLVLILSGVEGMPQEVQADISVPAETSLTLRENKTAEIDIDGFFTVTSTGPLDAVGGLTANLEITDSGWDPRLSQTIWTNVEVQTDRSFVVLLTIGPDTVAGERNSYTLTLTLSNSLSGAVVGTETAVMSVSIENILDDGREDDDDDGSPVVEDGSFPLWPFFLGAIVVGLIVVAIWAKMNLELVREEDGRRRVYIREKDSGRIVGRKNQPPPELEL
ncbi:MAG: hypothetical protein JW939_09940 [Candidatus Thermoplasmatota archaeon]|nr:hypothetical protein [Candidatus Thermoplasmatota archaeon]